MLPCRFSSRVSFQQGFEEHQDKNERLQDTTKYISIKNKNVKIQTQQLIFLKKTEKKKKEKLTLVTTFSYETGFTTEKQTKKTLALA
jgi:hypothetical protein